MITMWKRKEKDTWGHHRQNVDDLEMMKLSLDSGQIGEVDDQMAKLLDELKDFKI